MNRRSSCTPKWFGRCSGRSKKGFHFNKGALNHREERIDCVSVPCLTLARIGRSVFNLLFYSSDGSAIIVLQFWWFTTFSRYRFSSWSIRSYSAKCSNGVPSTIRVYKGCALLWRLHPKPEIAFQVSVWAGLNLPLTTNLLLSCLPINALTLP